MTLRHRATLLFVFLIGIIMSAATSSLFAWTGPQNTPPNCVAGQTGCDTPLNVGSGSQVKNGNLSVNAFTATQNSTFYGNLGVGSSNAPTYPLDVAGSIRATGGEVIGTLSSNYGQVRMIGGTYGAFWRNDGANTYLLLTATGDQYGTWNALRPFYVNDVSGAVTIGTSLTVSGNVTAAGFFHSSDASLKKDIRTAPGLELVQKLRGVTFDWKKDGAPSAGVIAQEVESVMPSAVHTDPKTGLKSVEYDQLVAPLIEAIKEQQAEIDSLKHEIDTLKVR
jgi:hypothetical protein